MTQRGKEYLNNLQAEISQYFCNNEFLDSDDEIDVLSDGSVSLSDEESVDSDSPKQDDITENVASLSESLCKLTMEEKNVINSCKNPMLKKALILNRQKALQCQELIKKINIAEVEVVEKYKHAKAKGFLDTNNVYPRSICKIGTPYFKDLSRFSHPQNADYKRKIDNHELIHTDFSEGRKWILEDQAALQTAVCESYHDYRTTKLLHEIRMVKVKLKKADKTSKVSSLKNVSDVEMSEESHDLQKQLSNLELQLREVRREENFKAPPLCDSTGVDWYKISQYNLSGKHSVEECKAFWSIYLHPSINKTNWTAQENEKILNLVSKYNWQDWDAIALELGTNRTGFMVIVHYYSKLCDKFKRNRFTTQEDKKLLEIIEKCRMGSVIPWQMVSNYFEDRSKHQLYHRYTYYLSHENIKKGTFTEAEDILILYLFERFGKDFSKISKFVPSRTTVQIRNRYSNYLIKHDINLGSFSEEDDKKLMKYVERNGLKKWAQISKELNRCRSHVRQRYMTIQKWRKKNPNCPLKDVPKRKLQFINRTHNQRIECMKSVLHKLKPKMKGVPTIKTIESYIKQYYKAKDDGEKMMVCKRKIKRESSVADTKLIAFFTSACKIPKSAAIPKCDRSIRSAHRIIKLLDLFGANTKAIVDKINIPEISPNCQLDVKVLTHIKDLYQNIGGNSNNSKQIVLPTTSAANRSIVEIPKVAVKEIIPPTISTCVGMRGFLIKSQHYKFVYKDILYKIKNQISSHDFKVCNTHHDERIKLLVCNEQKLFFNRLYAIFKWPSIISFESPKEELCKTYTVTEEKVEEIPVPEICDKKPGKIGRPKKKINNKIALMTEGRKRKQNTNDSIVTDELPSTSTALPSTSKELPLTKKVCGVQKEVTYYPSRTRHAGYAREKSTLLDKSTSIVSFARLYELDETSEDTADIVEMKNGD